MSATMETQPAGDGRGKRPISGPKPQRQRLASLKNPRTMRPSKRAAQPVQRSRCPNPECEAPDIQDADGSKVCVNCGTMINETNIVSEVTFGESSAGAAVVQGGFVGEGQTHARTMGSAFRRAGGVSSREVTEGFGRDEIKKQTNALSLPDTTFDAAFALYKWALNDKNFIQGRRIREVASVCLYVICRREKAQKMLLIDFAELLKVNVFKLGTVLADMKKALWITDLSQSGMQPVIEVEQLVHKYARKLEFGTELNKVANDAMRIIARMKRDWMVTGRHPAGLCGAAIILAARMNNFRRTVREVVYYVKVADMTITKRLEEFKRTESSGLSVEQFRTHARLLKREAEPPAIYTRREKAEKKKRKRTDLLPGDTEDDPEIIGEDDDTNTQQPTTVSVDGTHSDAEDQDTVRRIIPVDPDIMTEREISEQRAAPMQEDDVTASRDPSTETNATPKSKRPKTSRRPMFQPTSEDLIAEEQLQTEIEHILVDKNFIQNMDAARFNQYSEDAVKLAERVRIKDREEKEKQSQQATSQDGTNDNIPMPASPRDILSEEQIGEHEFDDDPEVANCLLSEVEQKIKERIWVTHNEDWLRTQQAKMLKKALDEANGGPKKAKRRRRRGRMGDGSVLEGGAPVEDAGDASQRMLEKRAKGFSKHINYEKLAELYTGIRGKKGSTLGTDATTESDARSDADTEIPNVTGESEPRSPINAAPMTPPPTAPTAPVTIPTELSQLHVADSTVDVDMSSDMNKENEKQIGQTEQGDEDEEDNDEDETRTVLENLGVDVDEFEVNEDVYEDEAEVGFEDEVDDEFG